MKNSLFPFNPFLLLVILALHVNSDGGPSISYSQRPAGREIIECAPGSLDEFYVNNEGKFITLLPGWGKHSYTIKTNSDSAQVYFNQGLSMYYSYHAREAIASFREAARFDSSCAMLYWAQALAMGPSYNFGYSYKMHANIPAVMEQMNRYSNWATAKEQDLIKAMNLRYNMADTTDAERSSLNESYAAALKPLIKNYPADLDIKALYVDAVMLLHSWDFWYNNGKPKAWTPELVKLCEDIMDKDPHHPAALHYYIHVTEASRKPEVALASADSLLKLFPGVAHMVHMSSHEYERIGYYAKGVDANEKADQSIYLYDSLAKGLFNYIHVPHYYSVDAYCAFSGGMYNKAMSKCMDLRNMVDPTPAKTYLQYQYMYPSMAWVRLGKWKQIISDTTTLNPTWSFAVILDAFAKGLAYTKTGQAGKAEILLHQLRLKKKDTKLKEKFAPHSNSPLDCASVAENILLANILFSKGKHDSAIAAIHVAMLAEDSLLYSEPKVWLIPARQYLGNFYMKLKQYNKAEKVYRDDLAWNPGNGWSALGLYQSLVAQQKKPEQNKLKAMYTNSFSHADEMPPASVY